MTAEEARAKYEDKIWDLLLKSRQIGALANRASIMLTRILDDMENDGFYPQLAISAIDHGLHGMAIIKIPEEELKMVREEYAKKYNENPLLKKESEKMIKEEIDQVHIEHRSEAKYWNITMFVVPRPGNSGKVPCYADLVEAAEDVIRKAKGLGKEWYARNAEVMAWSDNTDRGVLTPNRFRVTLDMITEAMESNADADE